MNRRLILVTFLALFAAAPRESTSAIGRQDPKELLDGAYSFILHGQATILGTTSAVAYCGALVFDGAGNVTTGTVTWTIGSITTTLPLVGQYSVQPNRTGILVLALGEVGEGDNDLQLAIAVAQQGDQVFLSVTRHTMDGVPSIVEVVTGEAVRQ